MRYEQLSPVPPLTEVTRAVIVTCVVVYFVDFVLYHLGVRMGSVYLNEILGLVPARVVSQGWYWQFFTYMFVHGHPLHLLLNMLILWYFGAEIELKLGRWQFVKYFLICGIGAGVFNFAVNVLFVDDVTRLTNPIIGASGAIFGILAAYGIFFGNRVFLVFFFFPMKAKYFVLVMAGIELVMGVEADALDNVAHFAHIGGLFVGGIYTYLRYVWRPRLPTLGRKDAERERLKRQFTLIVNPKDGKSKDDHGPFWN